jgi:hypothetical protein
MALLEEVCRGLPEASYQDLVITAGGLARERRIAKRSA